MNRTATSSIEALIAVAAVAWLTSALQPVLGLASSALLFLLPVLLAATRGGIVPALVAVLAGAGAYNYFLLEPRFTLRVHELDNFISVIVLGAVALVTSRLATRLMTREAEANERARASTEAAALSSLLAAGSPAAALQDGLAFVAEHYGPARLVDAADLARADTGLTSLDLSAAAWAIHNGDVTGHGTETLAAADWTFVPLAPRNRPDQVVLALAQPTDGRVRSPADLEQVSQLCLLLGQCRDRASLEAERIERERIETSDRLRRTFLASLAHDFRTPLTVIGGCLELLAQQSPVAAEALLAARRLDRMMGNLLEAARIDGGSLAVNLESLDPVDVIAAACDGLAPPAGVALHRILPAELPFVRGDQVLLHHILANLLDNAARHARTQVTVSAAVEADRLVLRVEDDGPGVPAAERTRIFDRFSRIEGTDRSGGSGLGLAIVKGFADAMGVPVTVDERPGGGARFSLSLHLAAGASA